MDGKQFARQMKELINDVKNKGITSINCDNLIAYLNDVESTPNAELSAPNLEKYKAELQKWVDDNKRSHDELIELFRSVVVFGQGAIKSLFLLNAGAVVVLLTFITHLERGDVAYFAGCIYPFAKGVLFAALLALCAYISQFLYAYRDDETLRRFAAFFHILCVALAAISLYLFWEGFTLTAAAFEVYGKR